MLGPQNGQIGFWPAWSKETNFLSFLILALNKSKEDIIPEAQA